MNILPRASKNTDTLKEPVAYSIAAHTFAEQHVQVDSPLANHCSIHGQTQFLDLSLVSCLTHKSDVSIKTRITQARHYASVR